MPRYVAFLRAINVGGHVVTMKALKEHFEELGCSGVETVIASGNVVFDAASRSAAALERRIAGHLQERLGYAVATFLRTPQELAGIAGHRPFARAELEAAGHSLFVGFHGTVADAQARRRVRALASEVDAFHLRGREVFWLCRGRSTDSSVYGGGLEKALGQPATVRNATTVRRIAEKYA
ncbi:MAG TPA: DUF1697 domain-containing protein [Thermoanaerobaculia bacterium]|nr:DUF1697 domain-containing protein [Thermoanaerobaculia bacterium]